MDELEFEKNIIDFIPEKATLLFLLEDAGFDFEYDSDADKYVSDDPNPALQVFLDKAINNFDITKYNQYYNVIMQVIESRKNGGNV